MNIPKSTRTAALIAASLTASLWACQTPVPPTVRSDTAPGVNIEQFRTWGFRDPLSNDPSGTESIATQSVKRSIEGEMLRRGLTVSATPDLLVDFRVSRRKAVSTVGRIGYGSGGIVGPTFVMQDDGSTVPGDPRPITKGIFEIEVVDSRSNTLVWDATAQGTLTSDRASDPEKLNYTAVHLVFKTFPPRVVDPAIRGLQ